MFAGKGQRSVGEDTRNPIEIENIISHPVFHLR